jgi:carboxyl-terminal processing protease
MKLEKFKIRSVILYLTSFIIIHSIFICKTTYALSPEARKYLEEVVSLLQSKSVNKNKIDWKVFKEDVFQHAKNSQAVKDTYPAVAYAVKKLEDNHSYFSYATEKSEIGKEKPLPVLKNEMVPSNIGYVRVAFCIGDETQTENYIASISGSISQQNNDKIKGWIVDLRDNFGGNMWPMMAALGPILDTGIQGYFLDADGNFVKWHYERGKAYSGTTVLAENNNFSPAYGKNRIALLINNKTASSGEAMAVLFKGYDSAKLFGQPTFGVSTGCESFTLSDGSRINLATSIFVDRQRKKYGTAVMPDVSCDDAETLSKAIAWLNDL